MPIPENIMSSLFILIIISLVLGFGALILMLWGNKREQFDDTEGPKYRIIDDEDDK